MHKNNVPLSLMHELETWRERYIQGVISNFVSFLEPVMCQLFACLRQPSLAKWLGYPLHCGGYGVRFPGADKNPTWLGVSTGLVTRALRGNLSTWGAQPPQKIEQRVTKVGAGYHPVGLWNHSVCVCGAGYSRLGSCAAFKLRAMKIVHIFV